jgi:hypothetical protein
MFHVKQEFEQRPNESAKAFAAFSLYLSLGDQRSAAAVAKQLEKSEQLIRRWCTKYAWVDRVDAYAKYLAKVESEAQTTLVRQKAAEWGKRQQELREEEWQLRGELIAAGRNVLKRFTEGGKGATLGDIARALELASKLGRLSSGLATDKTEVTGQDGGPIRVEFEAMLKKVYSEPIDVEVVPAGDGSPALPEKTGDE